MYNKMSNFYLMLWWIMLINILFINFIEYTNDYFNHLYNSLVLGIYTLLQSIIDNNKIYKFK